MELKLNIDLLIQKQVFYDFRFLRYWQLKYDSLNIFIYLKRLIWNFKEIF